jgi:hypothetical protein
MKMKQLVLRKGNTALNIFLQSSRSKELPLAHLFYSQYGLVLKNYIDIKLRSKVKIFSKRTDMAVNGLTVKCLYE